MLDKIGEKIINGSMDEYSLLRLAKERKLLEVYEGKTVIDYILEYKRNTKEFDKFSVYNSEIAIKYLDYGLKPNIDSEEIFMSKYDEEKTIFEKYIEKYFDEPFLNIISNLIKDGRSLKEILFCKIDNKYVFEHLEEKGLNTIITYMIVANDNKVLELIEKYDVLLYFVADGYVQRELYYLSKQTELPNLNLKNTINSKFRFTKLYKRLYQTYFSSTITYLDLMVMYKLQKTELEQKISSFNSDTNNIVSCCIKHDKWEFFSSAGIKTLMISYNGKMLIDLLYEKVINNVNYPYDKSPIIQNLRKKVAGVGKNSVLLANIAFNHGDFITALQNPTFLLKQEELSGETYLDIIIKKLLDAGKINLLIDIKYTSVLLTYKSKYLDGKMLIEYMIDNFKNYYEIKKMKSKCFNSISREKNKKILEFFIQKLGDSEYLKKTLLDFPEKILLFKNSDSLEEDNVLDMIIKRLLEINGISCISEISSLNILLYKSKYLENKTIIEYAIKNCSIYKLKNMFSPNLLLYMIDEKTTVLDLLIQKNRDFFLNELYPKVIQFGNKTINSILRANGIDAKMPIFLKDRQIDFYLKNRFEEQCSIEVPMEASQMLEELYNLLIRDERNDRNMIDLVVGSFRKQLAIGFKYAYRDLQTLIELIRQGKLYFYQGKKSEFITNGCISLQSPYYITDFEHEITHALHYFTNFNAQPFGFGKYFKPSSSKTKKIGQFVKSFHSKLDSFKKTLEDVVLDERMQDDYYDNYENEVKEAISLAQNNIDVPSEYLLSIIESKSSFNSLLQIENREEVFTKIAFEKFNVEFALENLFDALSYGKFFTTGIDYMGEHFRVKAGHGIEYFLTEQPFIEVIACYGEIIKSPRKEMGLAVLKDVMGQEFIDMLDEFYANMYLKDLDYKIENERPHVI